MRILVALLFAMPSGVAVAAPPAAVPTPPPVLAIDGVRQDQAGGPIVAHVLLMNAMDEGAIGTPDRLDATLHAGGRDVPVVLTRQGAAQRIPGKGWGAADYAVARPEGLEGSVVLSLGAGRQGYAFALSPAAEGAQIAAVSPAAVPPAPPQERPIGGEKPPLLRNLSPYQPVYALLGHGTDSDLLIQLSFQYQLFGHQGDANGSWLDGFHFGYTQRIYWDIGADSQPFRDESFQPELFYRYTRLASGNGTRLSAQAGFLHESNGKGGADSRGYQILYVQPQVDLPVGDYTLSVGPRLFHYLFSRDNNPDIARYRGHQALSLSIVRQDGLKISTTTRYNFGQGKGSFDGELSYPVRKLIGATPLYLVVQGFTGYGEDLLDYNRRQTRLRVGLGIIR
jgi:phospholipase A1